MKKEMSIRSQIFWRRTFEGALWLGAGIAGLFDTLAGSIVRLVFLVLINLVLVVLMKSKLEKDDEMSAYNYMKAKAETVTVMSYVYVLALTAMPALSLFKVDFTWESIAVSLIFVLFGIQDFIIGIKFRRLEAE